MIRVVEQMGYAYLPAGKKAYDYGESGGFFYIILDGSVKIMSPNDAKKRLKKKYYNGNNQLKDILARVEDCGEAATTKKFWLQKEAID